MVAENSAGAPALVVEVKTRPADATSERQLEKYVGSLAKAPFGMLVDPDEIRIYHHHEQGLHLVATLSTPAVLSSYEPNFGQMRVLEPYLRDLVGAWLRDLMDHWMHERPPAEDELRRVGLLALLQGGRTRSEVRVSGTSLP